MFYEMPGILSTTWDYLFVTFFVTLSRIRADVHQSPYYHHDERNHRMELTVAEKFFRNRVMYSKLLSTHNIGLHTSFYHSPSPLQVIQFIRS